MRNVGGASYKIFMCKQAAKECYAGLCVMIVLLCLTPVFKNMPQNAQAAIIISAVSGLFNYEEFLFLWKVSALIAPAAAASHDFTEVLLTLITKLTCPESPFGAQF